MGYIHSKQFLKIKKKVKQCLSKYFIANKRCINAPYSFSLLEVTVASVKIYFLNTISNPHLVFHCIIPLSHFFVFIPLLATTVPTEEQEINLVLSNSFKSVTQEAI